MGLIDQILQEDEEGISESLQQTTKSDQKSFNKSNFKDLIIFLVIFSFAFITGFYVLFKVTNPENAGVENWYSDTYHHWQIAYLSERIGYSHGFLRLWDLKGLEYFWGLAHPLIGSFLIWITGSTDIVLFRILSLVCGSVAIDFLFLIIKKSWGLSAGLAASLIGIFNPVSMFNNASGMVEPMGIMFMLSGIYFIESAPFLGGLLLAFAAATRAEYWILSAIVVGSIFVFKHNLKKDLFFFVGYLVPTFLYMKYLLNYTGNPTYPIWWNYLGNAAGVWEANIKPTPPQLFIQKVYIVITILALIGLVWVIKKGHKSLPFMIFGFGNWILWGVTIGMTKYLLSYLPRFWVDRIMIWPYLFVGSLISIAIFYYIPKIKHSILRVFVHSFSWLLVIVTILATQVLWKPIWYYYSGTVKSWNSDYRLGVYLGKQIGKDGRVLIPEYWPPVTYTLVNFGHVDGARLVSQMYDPYYYINGDSYRDWGNNRLKVLGWLKSDNIHYIVFTSSESRYLELIKRESQYFTRIDFSSQWNTYVYKVNTSAIDI